MAVLVLVLLIFALVCFVAAAFSLAAGRVNLVALGLASWVLTVVIGAAQGLHG